MLGQFNGPKSQQQQKLSGTTLSFKRAYATTTALLCDHIGNLLASKGFRTDADFHVDCRPANGVADRTELGVLVGCMISVSWGSTLASGGSHVCL